MCNKVQHDMSVSCLNACYSISRYGEQSLIMRDHNASGVDPGCFMVYNCFQFHGFITKIKIFSRQICSYRLLLTLLKNGFEQWCDANR